jgi:hypothetical protein
VSSTAKKRSLFWSGLKIASKLPLGCFCRGKGEEVVVIV